ncbi:hypothetical protein ABZ805_10510 [Saccharopolyspora sp. NPDC047091]
MLTVTATALGTIAAGAVLLLMAVSSLLPDVVEHRGRALLTPKANDPA